MLTYAGVTLLYDLDDSLAMFLERFMSLEGGRVFSDALPSHRELRHGTQGHASHLMGLPTFNWPPEPAPRINTLRWPSGATRWATFFAICTDDELDKIRQVVFDDAKKKMKPAQLVVADAAFGTQVDGVQTDGKTPDDNAWTIDSQGRSALSAEMWMLTPKRISAATYDTKTPDRIWVVPLVDVRYFWQFVSTDEAFFSDVKVIKTSDTKWKVEFIGKWSRQDVPELLIDGAKLTPPMAATNAVLSQSHSDTANEIQEVYLPNSPTCGTFTLTFNGEVSAPIPFDASAEELADAISGLPSFSVTWKTLCENCELSLDVFDQTADAYLEYGEFSDRDWFPDRTEFRRRHENVAMVLDAIAASTGRRVVRDALGVTYLMPAADTSTVNSRDNLESNLSVTGLEKWSQVAGGLHRATTSNAGNLLMGGLGPDIPEAIDVVFRDLTREGRSGELANGSPPLKWVSQSGLLTVTVPIEIACVDDSSTLKPFFPHVVGGLRHTIHTPSLNNVGTIVVAADGSGDNYSRLAVRIAARYYDWLWAAFDLTFASVKQWEPTGFDDALEIEHGRWRLGLDLDGERRAIVTRVTSLPRNVMPGQQLIQCGSQCRWTEDVVIGELRERLSPAGHSRLLPATARAWAFLPPMTLQGETEGLLWTHKRPITVTSRDIDAATDPGVFFESHSWFCENILVWLGCTTYCPGATDDDPSTPGAECDDETCEAVLIEDPDGGEPEYWCLDNGTMTPPTVSEE